MTVLTVFESIKVASFIMLIVFSGILGIYLCIKLFSFLVTKLEGIVSDSSVKKD